MFTGRPFRLTALLSIQVNDMDHARPLDRSATQGHNSLADPFPINYFGFTTMFVIVRYSYYIQR